MSSVTSLDVSGRRRSPATTAEFHLGRAPGNKGMTYPADPPRVEEIVAVMCQADDGIHGDRARALIIVLWRAGLRIAEALDLREVDLEPARCSCARARAAVVARSAWTTGAGSDSAHGLSTAKRCLPDRCSASSTDLHAAGHGPHRPFGFSFAASLPRPACAVGSRLTSSAMPTRSRWLGKACRST